MENLIGYWFLDENQQEVTVVHIWDKWCIVENECEEEPYILPLEYVRQIKKDSDDYGKIRKINK